MAFACSQCGECCSHMGLVHSIRADLGGNRFIIYNQYTCEEKEVEIDSDKHGLFADKSILAELPQACPFFRRKAEDGKGYCTVHLTRPDICRDFGCWRLLIVNPCGERAGRIMFRRFLATQDAVLQKVWDECIAPLDEPDDERWDQQVIPVLRRAGYRVIR